VYALFNGVLPTPKSWADTWLPLQPSAEERAMDPDILATRDDEVVVLWHQRGLLPGGERVNSPVLALYKLRNGKLARAQMFYFDLMAVLDFLAQARRGRS
jgi:uncharacterized protein